MLSNAGHARLPAPAARVRRLLAVAIAVAAVAPLAPAGAADARHGAVPAAGQAPPPPAPPAGGTGQEPVIGVPAGAADPAFDLNVADLAGFMDGMISTQLREHNVAGAAAAVVHEGRVALLEGYGFADVGARERVDPERTLFRIGSVTKLFTYTAVMQLAEEGLLDLDADVNRYLDFTIPATYAEPITLRHLLTHTAGFEEDLRNLFTEDPDRAVSLGDWVKHNLPARVRPPGTFSAYSNYGSALAGYVVERTAGTAWEAYVEDRILEPLGMRRTTGRQPLPESLAPFMSGGYVFAGGRFREEPWEVVLGAAPAGSISATASDMARFMVAFLGGGAIDGARVVDPATASEMLSRQFTHDPRLPGYGLGFYEMSSHGVRIVGHGGNTRLFHTVLALFPEHELGVFVTYNTASAAPITYGAFLHTFLDRYFPDPPAPAVAGDPAELASLAGNYRFNRISYTTFQKAMGLVMNATVREDDGYLRVGSPLGSLRFVQVGPLLFREELGATTLAFRTGDDGTPTHAFVSLTPMMAAERVPWHGAPPVHFTILGGGILLFAVLLVGGAVGWIRRKRRPTQESGPLVLGRRALLAAAAANLAFVALVAILVQDLWSFLTTPMTGLAVALAFPVLGAAASVVAAGATATLWWRRGGTVLLRIGYTAAAAVGLLFAWSMNYWNLLGWRL